MDAPEGERGDEADEERERYQELLSELRTVIPGVQVLFAFLLTVPFSSRFDALDALGTRVFALSLVTVALATVVLMTPAMYHRLTPRHDREQRIKLGVRVTIAGMTLLAVAIGTSVFVVGRLIFQVNPAAVIGDTAVTAIGVAVSAVVAGAAVLLWFVLPFLRRNR